MKRSVLVACLCLVASAADADEMDPALSRLRVPAGHGSCPAERGYCPDQELFERLVSEIAVAMTTPVSAPAHSEGPRGFYVGLSTTATRIASDGMHWLRGSQGPASGDAETNEEPDSALVWHRLELRRGLPFGVELGGSLGHAGNTSFWSLGGQIKVALFEGFRHGWGALPDVSVRLSWDLLAGVPALSAAVTSLDLVLSKPFVLGNGLRLAPLAGGQLSAAAVSSGQVDFTPGLDAFAECRPQPKLADDLTLQCDGDASDSQNAGAFKPVRQLRLRFVAGAGLELAWFRLGGTLLFDFAGLAPHLHVDGREWGGDRVSTHIAGALSAGAVF